MEVITSLREDYNEWLVLAAEVEKLFGPMVSEASFCSALLASIEDLNAYCIKNDSEITGPILCGGIILNRLDNEIAWLAVSEKYQGKGIGDALVKYAINSLDNTRPMIVVTFNETISEGKPARNLYHRYGFVDMKDMGFNPAGIPIVMMVKPIR